MILMCFPWPLSPRARDHVYTRGSSSEMLFGSVPPKNAPDKTAIAGQSLTPRPATLPNGKTHASNKTA